MSEEKSAAEGRPQFPGAMYGCTWRRFPLFREDSSNIYYGNSEDYWESQERQKQPVDLRGFSIKNPVPLAFDPWSAIHKDDAKEHEGISFARLWADPVARTLWLGYKPFQITSQYFRRGCVDRAEWLREHPEDLLRERLGWNLDASGFFLNEWQFHVGAQLAPYLVAALQEQSRWPFWRMRLPALGWRVDY